MLNQLTAHFEFDSPLEKKERYAVKVSIVCLYNCKTQQELQFNLSPFSGIKPAVEHNGSQVIALNERSINQSNTSSYLYRVNLLAGENILTCNLSLSCTSRLKPALFFKKTSSISTLYFDSTPFIKIGKSDDLIVTFISKALQTTSWFSYLLKGPLVFLYASRTKDEERGITHKTKTRFKDGAYHAILKQTRSIPDIVAINCGYKKYL